MNKGSKFLVGTLCAVTALGAVGGVSYKQIPSFKNSIDKAFKINDNKANIGFETPDENISEGVKPITPEEFASTYKFSLPSTFLGGMLYVIPMDDNNLVVSSSVGFGMVLCDITTGISDHLNTSQTQYDSLFKLSNGVCLMYRAGDLNSGASLVAYNPKFCSIRELVLGTGFSAFLELSNGNCIFSYKNYGSGYALAYYNSIDDSVVSYSILRSVYKMTETILGDVLFSYSNVSTSERGVWMFDCTKGTIKRLNEYGGQYSYYVLSNGNILISSHVNSYPGIWVYSIQDDSITQIYDKGYTYIYSSPNTIIDLSDGKYLISNFSSSYKGVWLFDCRDNSFVSIKDSMYSVSLISRINDSILLVKTGSGVYSFNIETSEFVSLGINRTFIQSFVVNDTDLLLQFSQGSTHYLYRYNFVDNACSELCTFPYSASAPLVFKLLSNGNCLIGSSSSLKLYDCNIFSLSTIINSINVVDIVDQEDGTYLCVTDGDYDYEYSCEDNSIKLVYTVTQAE